MKLRGIMPSCDLRPYIDRYWAWENELSLPDILPGTGNELMFHYAKPWLTLEANGEQRLPVCYILSPRNEMRHVRADETMGFVSVRFRAGAFRHFSPLPVCEIVDHAVPVGDIWGCLGRNLQERLLEAKDLAQRIRILEQELRKLLLRFQKKESWLDEAVRQLYYRRGEQRTSLLCEEVFIGDRQLQRKIKEVVGVTPKVFQRLVRFEGVLRRLLLQRKQDYLELAMEYGYYDQAHFIKEFKSFIGETPSGYLQEKIFASHYYCEKI